MRNVLILDTETDGLDPAVNRVLEVAGIVYSVEHATVLHAYSTLVHAESNAAEHINRIPTAALIEGASDAAAWSRVKALVEDHGVEAFVAHHADFDRGFAPVELRGLRPWICSRYDIEWPRQTKPGPSLVALALEHDLGVAYAHRAMADCDLLARLFTRSRELGADLDAMLARALRPKAEFLALVSFDERELAKVAGFTWFPDAKQWRRRMFIDDAAALPFRTKQLAA